MGRHSIREQPPTPEEPYIPEQQTPAESFVEPSPTLELPLVRSQESVTEPLPVQRYAPAPEQVRPQQGRDADPGRRKLVIGFAAVTLVAATGVTGLGYEKRWWLNSSKDQSPQSQPGHPKTSVERPIRGLPPEFDHAKKETLITDTWHMLGATRNKDGSMGIKASGWAVRTVDDSAYIAHPPQLLVGPRLEPKGNGFGVAGRISSVAGPEAALIFRSEPDVVLDEEVHRAPAVAVRVGGHGKEDEGKIFVDVYNGKTNAPVSHALASTSKDGVADFWIQQDDAGRKVTVGSGEHSLTVNTSMFKDQVILGTDGDFALNTLDVYATGKEAVTINDTSERKLPAIDPNGFQGIAHAQGRKDLTIIDAVDFTSIEDSWGLLSNVGGLETEMMAKLQAVYNGTPDADGNIKKEDFDFTEVHALIDLAKRSGNREVILHALAWGEASPIQVESFLRTCIKTGNTKAALNFEAQHVGIMVDEFKDLVTTIDVVNEPMGDTSNDDTAVQLQKHLLSQATGGGTNHVGVALKTAKEHGAKRVRVNENGLETGTARRAAFVKALKPYAKYIDAIGLQCHLDPSDYGDWVNDDAGGRVDATYVRDDLGTVVDELKAELSVEVDFSELSVDAEDSDVQNAEQIQAAVYAGVANAAIRNHNVKKVGTWGLLTNKRYMTTTFNNNGSVELGNDAPWKESKHKPVARAAVAAFKAGLRNEIRELA